MTEAIKPSESKKPTGRLLPASQAEIVAEWLCKYALVFRDFAGSAPVQITAQTVEAYVAFLSGCGDLAALARAMRVCGERAKAFPRPNEILAAYQAALEVQTRGSASCEECEGAGWMIREGGLRRCGRCAALPGTGEKGEKA